MSISVGVNPPKTPVTAGSNGVAKATTPNVCKMPGPPAPFIASPLPNIAKSGNSPSGYSTSVKIESESVAIRGATFESIGDVASKGTGGGLISANTQGPAKFITPGSPTVKIEGKSVHILGEPMLNNCGANGNPPNTGATTAEDQGDAEKPDAKKLLEDIAKECNDEENEKEDKQIKAKKKKRTCQKLGQDKHDCCERKIQEHRKKNPENGYPPVEGERGYNRPKFDKKMRLTQPADTKPLQGSRKGSISQAITDCANAAKKAGRTASRKEISAAIQQALKGKVYPDAAILGSDPEKTFVDFKFACPESHRSKKKSTRKNYRPPKQGRRQRMAHDALGHATGGGKSITIQIIQILK